jgi:2-dehydro-3-deoxygluconokinase
MTHNLLALGALVTRLDPGVVPFSEASDYKLWVSGGEYNVAANLSSCFGLDTAVASAITDTPIGGRVEKAARWAGVTPYWRRFHSDGVRGPNMAVVWSDRGYGQRAPQVFYNRANEAAALLKPGDFDFAAIFSGKQREGDSVNAVFHSGGIFASLSKSAAELVLEVMESAKAAGLATSFDLNYRAKLWKAAETEARPLLREIVQRVDTLFANEEDLQLGLGCDGIEETVRAFPRLRSIAQTNRVVLSANRHLWSAGLWHEGRLYAAPECELDVYDRVGGGDGFAAGLLYGFITGKEPEESLRLGWAHGALLTGTPGDASMLTLDQVETFASGATARRLR